MKIGIVGVIVVGLPSVAVAQQMDAETFNEMLRIVRWSGIVTSLFVVAGAWLLLRFVRDFVERLSGQFTNLRLLLQQVETFFQFFVYVGVGIAILMLSLRLDDRALAVVGGTLAVSIGFALKDLVASMVAGIVIIADRPFQVGDRIAYAGQYGDVTAVGLRSVRIQTLDDSTVTVPNNKFLTDVVVSGNYGELDMQVVLDFYVGADEDVALAQRILHDAAISSRYVYLPKPCVVLVSQLFESNYVAVRLRLKAYVLDTRHEMAFGTDITLRVLKAFRERGIRAPRMLVQGENVRGTATGSV